MVEVYMGSNVSISIQPFSDALQAAVRAFNERIATGDEPLRFPESPVSERFPLSEGPVTIRHESFLAIEGDDVRGGYVLQPQEFYLRNQVRTLASYQCPLSEGVLDKRCSLIGVMMLQDALKRQPYLFALGMGGHQQPVARMFELMKWRLVECPFYFRVKHPFRFFQQISFLRRSPVQRLVMNGLAISGLGWLGLKALQAGRGVAWGHQGDVTCSLVERFSNCAEHVNRIWENSKDQYEMIGVRDASALDTLYDNRYRTFLRLTVSRGDVIVGWAVLLIKNMLDHRYFGSLRVGIIVDVLAESGGEHIVARAATNWLQRDDVDLMITNQLHLVWRDAFKKSGYLTGPSNFIFGVSPSLATDLAPFEASVLKTHMTRGDADGLYNL